MRPKAPRSSLIAAILLCVAALALGTLPEGVLRTIRMAAHDAALPGLRVLQWTERYAAAAAQWIASSDSRMQREERVEEELAGLRLSCRQLLLANAALRKRLEQTDNAPATARGEPLVTADLLEATVLGADSVARLRSELLVDRGSASGAQESALVLEAATPLVDQGRNAGVLPDQPVYAGRAIVGRINSVGRWVSTVRLVTDAQYSDLVQLARTASDETAFYGRGILRGQGSRYCRLENVPATEPVGVGDEVYSVPADETISQPMYYGRVVSAELEEGRASWCILVEPIVLDSDLRSVNVLRKIINPARLLAN